MKNKALSLIPLMTLFSASLSAIEKTSAPAMKPIIDPLSGANVFQMVAGLVFVLIIVIAVAWLVRRVGGVTMAGGGAMSVVGGMSMGARERVVLLQVGDEQILIGVSPGRISKLHVLEKPIEPQLNKLQDSGFAKKLSEVLRGKLK